MAQGGSSVTAATTGALEGWDLRHYIVHIGVDIQHIVFTLKCFQSHSLLFEQCLIIEQFGTTASMESLVFHHIWIDLSLHVQPAEGALHPHLSIPTIFKEADIYIYNPPKQMYCFWPVDVHLYAWIENVKMRQKTKTPSRSISKSTTWQRWMA